MDPISAIGLASSILQIVDFGTKVLSKGNKLHKSLSGALPESLEIESVSTHLKDLSARLRGQREPGGPAAAPIGNDQALHELVNRCGDVADEILSALSKLKVQGKRSKWKSYRQAVKSVWNKGKIDEMLQRLMMIRDEVELGIIVDIRDGLVELSLQQSDRLDAVDQATRLVLQAVVDGRSASAAISHAQTRATEAMGAQLGALFLSEHQKTREEILGAITQQYSILSQNQGPSMFTTFPMPVPSQIVEKPDLLQMLRFQTIDDRQESIAEAHRQTFEWVWKGSGPRERPWHCFSQWLSDEGGIYWVSGKAGSGKSTLMKYLYHHSRTSELLAQWSSPTEVVMAGFFFWHSGSMMQKTQLGLLQSILHEALQKKPELQNVIFPPEVQEEASLRWRARLPTAETIWTLRELETAFTNLIQQPSLKICLLIDGLDEYDGDHVEIAQLFMGVINSPGVKICVSSRPLIIFETLFRACPNLRLQDLTFDDIYFYVKTKLEGQDEVLRLVQDQPGEFASLINEIILKASGVFLWVSLVVKSLIEGLTNYDRMSDLRRRVKEIPDDLSHLYWHMLRSIKPSFYLGQAAKLLRIVHTAYLENRVLNLQELSLAEAYEPGAPLPRAFGEIRDEEAQSRSKMIEGRVKSRCRGLLEVHSAGSSTPLSSEVNFLHQSVREFLNKPDVRKTLDEQISENFSPYACLLACSIAMLKSRPPATGLHGVTEQRAIDEAFHYARKGEEETGRAPSKLLEELNRVGNYLLFGDIPSHIGKLHSYHVVNLHKLWQRNGLEWAGLVSYQNCPRPPSWDDTLASLCAERGLVRYVSELLDEGLSMHQGPSGRPLLDFVVQDKPRYFNDGIDPPSRIAMCAMLLERGANPNEMFKGRTVWENVLGYVRHEVPTSFLEATPPESLEDVVSKRGLFFPVSFWVEILRLFIRHGADPNAGWAEPYHRPGHEMVHPACEIVRQEILPHDRRAGREICNLLVVRGGVQDAFVRPMCKRGPPAPTFTWRSLPEPTPDDIPGPFPNPAPFLNMYHTPDYEGLIPVLPPPPSPSLSPHHYFYHSRSHSHSPSSSPVRPSYQPPPPSRHHEYHNHPERQGWFRRHFRT